MGKPVHDNLLVSAMLCGCLESHSWARDESQVIETEDTVGACGPRISLNPFGMFFIREFTRMDTNESTLVKTGFVILGLSQLLTDLSPTENDHYGSTVMVPVKAPS